MMLSTSRSRRKPCKAEPFKNSTMRKINTIAYIYFGLALVCIGLALYMIFKGLK